MNTAHVVPYRCAADQNDGTEKRSSWYVVRPRRYAGRNDIITPPWWYIGMKLKTSSPGAMYRCAHNSVKRAYVSCERTTAFGSPVVPEVCMRNAVSDGSTRAGVAGPRHVSSSSGTTRPPLSPRHVVTRTPSNAAATASSVVSSVNTTVGVTSSKYALSSRRLNWWLTGATTAPANSVAVIVTTKSTSGRPTSATRSPRPTPSSTSPDATRVARSTSSAYAICASAASWPAGMNE